jgi:hypothetical protein
MAPVHGITGRSSWLTPVILALHELLASLAAPPRGRFRRVVAHVEINKEWMHLSAGPAGLPSAMRHDVTTLQECT